MGEIFYAFNCHIFGVLQIVETFLSPKMLNVKLDNLELRKTKPCYNLFSVKMATYVETICHIPLVNAARCSLHCLCFEYSYNFFVILSP